MDKRRCEEKRQKRQRILRYVAKNLGIILFSFFCTGKVFSQELFPNTEPATTLSKKLLAYRQINEVYRDINDRARYYAGFRLMYGLLKNLTLMSTLGYSNHHLKTLPPNFTGYILNHHKKKYPTYPYLIEGINLYVKYNIVNFDEQQKHLRISAYGEVSKSFIAHTEAEPNLMTENSGYGGGLIFTRLYKRFAASVTWGFINSFAYKQQNIYNTVKFKSGNAVLYNVSFGYRLYPKVYDSYSNVNINLYAEFINIDYQAAKIYYDGLPYNYNFLNEKLSGTIYTYNGLIANKYSELRSSIQFIFNSTNRLDIGAAVPIYHRSYLHDYPLIFVNFQTNFFKQ
jgi:hypothetical protein